MDSTACRTLFILAGMPGTGKSRLLQLALSKASPIFGEADNEVFQKTRPASVYPEEQLSLETRLRMGTWVNATHIVRLPASALSSQMVVHLDLFRFLQLLRLLQTPQCQRDLPASLAQFNCLSFEALSAQHRVEAAYRALLSLPFFRCWDRIVVNTLRPSYARTVAQWTTRESVLQRPHWITSSPVREFLRDRIYDSSNGGQQVYDALYERWQRAISWLKPGIRLSTAIDDNDAFQIRQKT